jgi:hypothetical protein
MAWCRATCVAGLTNVARPGARCFRIRFRATPYVHLDPGMCLQPMGHGSGFPVGKEGQTVPYGEVQKVIRACASSRCQVSRWSGAKSP